MSPVSYPHSLHFSRRVRSVTWRTRRDERRETRNGRHGDGTGRVGSWVPFLSPVPLAQLPSRHHHLTTVHVTPLRYAHSLFLGEVTNRVNERSGVTVNGGDGNGVTSWPLRVSFCFHLTRLHFLRLGLDNSILKGLMLVHRTGTYRHNRS